MRSFLMSAACAVALLSAAVPASAASYGWPTSFGEQEWMNNNFKTSSAQLDESDVPARKSAKAPRVSRKSVATVDDGSAPGQGKRRLPAMRYEDVGTGRGQSGVASYYWQPQRVASGGWFNPNALTAAHKTLPFGTRVRVTYPATGRSVTVTINDRGPYIAGRVIDLSAAAAGAIGMKSAGVARINMQVLGR